ncbi:MAG: PilZ domain-containing protein [Terriglobia bacterium]|jgi:hypothetical protein
MDATPAHARRQTDRVGLVVRIRILGLDLEGHAFSEEARTVEVSRHGALIRVKRNLAPLDEILIRRDPTGKEATAQVMGQVRKEGDEFCYGVRFVDPEINLWDINFVPLTDEARAVGRTLLECARCQLREVVYLEEFEVAVYQANRHVFHPCKRCRESTIWKEIEYEPAERDVDIAPPPPPSAPPEQAPAARTKNERRHHRITCKLTACIRFERHYDDEVLPIVDASRGGVCFQTRKYLAPGTRIEVAMPYSEGMANIFVPAEIVRLRPIPDKNLYECGAAYLKK